MVVVIVSPIEGANAKVALRRQELIGILLDHWEPVEDPPRFRNT